MIKRGKINKAFFVCILALPVGLAVAFVLSQVLLLSLPPLDLKAVMTQGNAGQIVRQRLSHSPIVVDRNDRLLRAFTAKDGRWRLPVRQEAITPHYFKLLLNFEDQGFYRHNGVELLAFVRAGWQWLSNGRVISGGSTLTMQVARLLEGRHERSLLGKWRQVKLALQLEKALTKAEILDLYLRLTPFGGNLEGVRAASLAYFGKEPARLSLAEAATLVALPQAPEGRRPDRFPGQAKVARDRVLKRAFLNGVISKGDYLFAKRQTVISIRRSFPVLAPHLSEKLVAERLATKQKQERTLAPLIIKTSLSRPLQEMLERLAKRHATGLGPGLSAAVLVVNHQTGDVLAHVG